MEGSIAGENALVLTDVCPFTLGTSVLDDNPFGARKRYHPIIPRNTTIPVERSDIFYPATNFQDSVLIDVYQGDAEDIENNSKLGDVYLSLDGIRKGKAASEAIEVTYAYDVNGILQVKGRIVSTGQRVEATINTVGIKPLAPVDPSKWMEHPDYRKYRPVLRKAERLLDDIMDNEEDREDPEEDARDIKRLIRLVKESLALNNTNKAAEYRDELTELLDAVGE
jgi:molecular chaperone DnaK (HSP70)